MAIVVVAMTTTIMERMIVVVILVIVLVVVMAMALVMPSFVRVVRIQLPVASPSERAIRRHHQPRSDSRRTG